MRQLLKTILVVSVLAGAVSFVKAQKTLNFPQVDKETYTYYLGGQWKELIGAGKEAKQAGIDFYYLQIRMGIAYYNLKKYRQAIPCLEKALEQSPNDEFTKEYLYFAYLFSGQSMAAAKLAATLPDDFRKKAGINFRTGISAIEFETKFDQWNDYQVSNSDYTVEQSIQESYKYFGLGIESRFRKGTSFLVNFSRVSVLENYQGINTSDNVYTGTSDIAQNQLYMKIGANLKDGFNFTASVTGLLLSFQVESLTQYTDSTTTTGTSGSGNGYGSGSGSGSGTGSGTIQSSSKTTSNQFVAWFSLTKDFSLFKIGINSSISNLYSELQIQPGINFTFYPLGNTNLYTYSQYFFQFENLSTGSVNRSIFKQAVGIGLWGFYIEPSVTFGELTNFIEAEGFVVNNARDVIKDRYEVLAYTWLFKGKLGLFAKYQSYNRENIYLINSIQESVNYNYQTISGGIRWNF